MHKEQPLAEYKNVTVSYDSEADAWYIDIDAGHPYDDQYAFHRVNSRPKDRTVVIDYDDDGYPVGIEII